MGRNSWKRSLNKYRLKRSSVKVSNIATYHSNASRKPVQPRSARTVPIHRMKTARFCVIYADCRSRILWTLAATVLKRSKSLMAVAWIWRLESPSTQIVLRSWVGNQSGQLSMEKSKRKVLFKRKWKQESVHTFNRGIVKTKIKIKKTMRISKK